MPFETPYEHQLEIVEAHLVVDGEKIPEGAPACAREGSSVYIEAVVKNNTQDTARATLWPAPGTLCSSATPVNIPPGGTATLKTCDFGSRLANGSNVVYARVMFWGSQYWQDKTDTWYIEKLYEGCTAVCEVACQCHNQEVFCVVSSQACETECETSCQEACEQSCQEACEKSCQEKCEVTAEAPQIRPLLMDYKGVTVDPVRPGEREGVRLVISNPNDEAVCWKVIIYYTTPVGEKRKIKDSGGTVLEANATANVTVYFNVPEDLPPGQAEFMVELYRGPREVGCPVFEREPDDTAFFRVTIEPVCETQCEQGICQEPCELSNQAPPCTTACELGQCMTAGQMCTTSCEQGVCQEPCELSDQAPPCATACEQGVCQTTGEAPCTTECEQGVCQVTGEAPPCTSACETSEQAPFDQFVWSIAEFFGIGYDQAKQLVIGVAAVFGLLFLIALFK